MLSFLRLSVWLRATGLLLEQSQTLKVWCHSFRSLRLIWPNAERAFSAETPDGCSRRQSRPSDRDHRVPITGCSKSCLLGAEYQEMRRLRQPHCDVSFSILEEGDHAVH